MAAGRGARVRALRTRIAALERGETARAAGVLRFHVPALDDHLPWGGLPLGALHEIVSPGAGGPETASAAAGFCAALLARLAVRGPVLWIAARPDIYAPGLLGFAPGASGARGAVWADRLVLVRARGRAGILWAMEEALRTPGLGAVVAEARALDATASRRLQLAAESHGVTALLLCPEDACPVPGAALTRWCLTAAPSDGARADGGVGRARWRAALVRCRGGRPADWLMEWCDETARLAVVPELPDRPAVPAPAARAG